MCVLKSIIVEIQMLQNIIPKKSFGWYFCDDLNTGLLTTTRLLFYFCYSRFTGIVDPTITLRNKR